MDIVTYAFAAYLGTAVISLILIGVIVLMNKLFGGKPEGVEE